MDFPTMEKLRRKKLFKYISLMVLDFFALIALLVSPLFVSINTTVLTIAILVLLVIYSLTTYIPKNFEKMAKKELLPNVLKNILSGMGDIKWQGSAFVADADISVEEKTVDALKGIISKQCLLEPESDDELDKYLEYSDEKDDLEDKLEETGNLTPEEEARLKELEAYIEIEDAKTAKRELEKYQIRNKLLSELEQSNPTQENLIKIEYLKKENKLYEAREELRNLCEKTEGEAVGAEAERIDQLIEMAELDYEEKMGKLYETSASFNRGSCLFRIFNKTVEYDDVFFGNYKDIEFLAIEGKENSVFEGTVIRIPLKKEFENKVLIHSKNDIFTDFSELKKSLHPIAINALGRHEVLAESPDDITEIINDNFIGYANANPNYSYMFHEDYAYLIWQHHEDFFKLGSLFTKIDDPKQYGGFERDLRAMLDELEKFGNGVND